MSQRSPNYPAASLEEAANWLRLFFNAARRNPVDGATAAQAIGFKSLNGTTRMKLSAMKKFGLLKEGANGTLAITDLGLRIVHPSPDGLDDALREAALTPEIFRTVYATHADSSQSVLTSYLIREKEFTPDGATVFEKVFRETVIFAKLGDSAYLAAETPGAAPKVDPMENTVARPVTRPPAATMPPAPPQSPGSVLRTFTTGTDTMDAEIRITSHAGEITGEDIAFLKDYLSFLEKGWSRRKSRITINTAPPAPQPLSASMPIMITKQQESDLRAAGYTQERIDAMTPQQAHDILNGAKD